MRSSETLGEQRRLRLLAHGLVGRHYQRRVTLEAVARALASSPRQVQRAYAEFGGVSFREDLLAVRMQVAAQLLLEYPELSVSEVSRLVGYGQSAHFIRAFRRFHGVTPARFRRP